MKGLIKRVSFGTAAIFIAFASAAYASSPIKTFDTQTAGKGRFDLSLGSEFADAKNDDEFLALSGELTYGAADNVDLSVKGAYLYRDPSSSGSVSGIGDPAIEGKFIFIQQDYYPISFGLLTGIKFPSGDKDKGLGNEKTDFYGIFLFSKEFDRCRLFSNVGLSIVGDPDSTDTQNEGEIYSIAADYRVNDRLDILAEFYVENGAHIRYNPYQYLELDKAIGIGLTYDITENLSLNLGGIADIDAGGDDVGIDFSVGLKI